MNAQAPIKNTADALTYLQGARSTATLKSKVTGRHFTFRVTAPKGDKTSDVRFVSVLAGGDNADAGSYRYVGMVKGGRLHATRKGMQRDATSFRAFDYALDALAKNKAGDLEVWHHGRCCRCGRKLTDPVSIAAGIGPVCAGR